MNTKIVLFAFLFLIKVNAQNILNKVEYKVGRYNTMYENNPNLKQEQTNFDVELNLLDYVLLYDNSKSIFYLTNGMSKSDDFEAQSARVMAGGTCYKNLITLEKIEQIDSFDQQYNVIKDINEYSWEITNEIKIINGYKCFKAITKKELRNELKASTSTFNPVVWFCPEIPSVFGPKGLDGLPGLVLEGTFNGRIYFYATKINFNNQENLKIEKPTKGQFVTETEMTKIDLANFKKYNEIRN